MNAPFHPQQIHMDALEVFQLRSWARAELYAACEFDLAEAVDVLQDFAEVSGLVADVGQDAVQEILRHASYRVRP
jgi:hypothetical protein